MNIIGRIIDRIQDLVKGTTDEFHYPMWFQFNKKREMIKEQEKLLDSLKQ